jgi:molybdopterin synthase catalytic subunit
MKSLVIVQEAAFDAAAEAIKLQVEGAGAVATFTGIARADDGMAALELEHFPGMTEQAVTDIAREAGRRWPISALTVIHRYGRLVPGDPIVFVGAASSHRGEAIAAMNFVIDTLKTDAPFWKREHLADGSARWVEAKSSDDNARDRWRETNQG